MLQDFPETPKHLLTFTVGVSQEEGVNEAVKKVCWWILMTLYIFIVAICSVLFLNLSPAKSFFISYNYMFL